MNRLCLPLFCLLAIVVPVAAAQTPPVPLTKAAPAGLPASLIPGVTVTELMKDTLDPAAQALWRAVSYVATEQGTTETMPTTDEDWAALRKHADTLVRASSTLLLPVLKVGAGPAVRNQAWQYSADEIGTLREQNPRNWREATLQLQQAAQELIGAIEKRDVMSFQELGVPINRACESCHGEFWYKPPGRQPR